MVPPFSTVAIARIIAITTVVASAIRIASESRLCKRRNVSDEFLRVGHSRHRKRNGNDENKPEYEPHSLLRNACRLAVNPKAWGAVDYY